MRRGPGRQHQGREVSRRHQAGPGGADQPRAPGRGGRRSGDRRRRGHHDADAARVHRIGVRKARSAGSRCRELRHGYDLPAAGPGRARKMRGGHRADRGGRGAGISWLARRADISGQDRYAGRARDAGYQTVHGWPVGDDRKRQSLRGEAVRHPQADRKGHSWG